jgi:hypothetical protein
MSSEFWSDGGIPLENLDIWTVQLCSCCGAHSKAFQNEIDLADQGWVVLINLNLCPDCKDSIFDIIRQNRRR